MRACPICACDRYTFNIETNHEPLVNGLGNIVGVAEGVPHAILKCANLCTVFVVGTDNVGKLAKRVE